MEVTNILGTAVLSLSSLALARSRKFAGWNGSVIYFDDLTGTSL